MPIYEYQCKNCQHQFEAFQKITDAVLTTCPECHQAALTKLISSTSFQLKGTGWYATDIRDKGKAPQKDEATEKTAEQKPTTDDTKSKTTDTKGKTDSSSSGSSQTG